MSATSSLTLQALLKRAASHAGLDPARLDAAGLTPSAKALAIALAAGSGSGVVIVPTDRDVEQMTTDARFFFGALTGSSESAVERAVLPFPSHQVDLYRGMHVHFRVASARARALHALSTHSAHIVIASAAALLPNVAEPARMRHAGMDLKPGTEVEPLALADLLLSAGFSRQDPVDEHGQFTVRGGILDLFPAGEPEPIRIEFVGDMVESLRRYDPGTQRSTGAVDQLTVVPLVERFEDEPLVPFLDFAAECGARVAAVSEFDLVAEQVTRVRTQLEDSYEATAATRARMVPAPAQLLARADAILSVVERAPRLEELAVEDDQNRRHVSSHTAMEYHGRITDWIGDLREARSRGDRVLFVAASAGIAERTVEILREHEVPASLMDLAGDAPTSSVLVAVGALSRGFRLPAGALVVFSETDVFDEERHAGERRRNIARTFLSDLRDLHVGDLIVHVDHGVGEFVGLKALGVATPGSANQEFLELRYANDDKLFVPVERLDLVQKYTGGNRPALDRLGGTTWEKAKTRVKKAMRDMAEELLKLYAQRRAVAGHAFPPDTHWQEEFEGAFPYDLTADQATAVADIKRDMESSIPMDRLLCGDVGYGKTEVAIRAAFKSVMDGKQVAFLAPTTVLAFQHLKTLRERLAGFPVTVDMVSRFRTKAEQQDALAGVASGKIDIIVGTHRLLSKDVRFRDLGLLVVDEEQRFGVAHKERIKQMRKRVDVLTLSATPIPRTLNMSLIGIRDMSVIETPPKDRLSIQTSVVKFDASVIERAIRNELSRGGQVYFVHNRVESIFAIGDLLQRLVPEARITVGHGQMGEDELERAMLGFVERKFDILLATTIVENGLDIPNANTIIINRADRYGLSQLYQLRGRVGRSDRPAYAYLLIPPDDSLSDIAKKRLAAIREFSDLGSGFRVAALDLELRGAGNLLGGEQSGHIDAVGFEMYMKLLEETVRELKGEELEDDVRATVNLKVDLRIEDGYVPDMNQRLMVYRKIAESRTETELDSALAGVRDRYGPLSPALLNLAEYGRVRILADRLGVDTIDREGRMVVIRFRQTARIDPTRLVRVVQESQGLVLVPAAALKLDLDAAARPAPPKPKVLGGPRPRMAQPERTPAWWTARATAGEVTPGFSKAEIQKAPAEDPRAEGGLFDRLEAVLRSLQ